MAINISYSDLRSTAASFRTERQNILDSVDEIKRIMQTIDSNNESEALSELASRFDFFRNGSMDNCLKLVERFAAFLDNAAQTYEKTDTTLKANVESGVGNKSAFKQ
ncbi:MAG: WXG100 family type VII secretion target [Oscillospiraceae bacterium]|nr:WXG100 family type VII secretion target [Oscillospiraceae bacterium]